MPSAVIRAFSYDAERRELLVTFTTERRYVYEDVPAQVVEAMRGAFSKGRYFNRNIRTHYRFRELP